MRYIAMTILWVGVLGLDVLFLMQYLPGILSPPWIPPYEAVVVSNLFLLLLYPNDME